MTNKDEEYAKAKTEAKSMVIYNGQLKIHYNNGTIDFESGGIRVLRVTHLPTPIPPGFSIDLVAVSNLASYTQFELDLDEDNVPGDQLMAPMLTAEERKQAALEASLALHPSTGRYSDEDEQQLCSVCANVHTPDRYAKWGPFTFIAGHEYIIWTRSDLQTYAHRSRMGFLGQGPSDIKYQLQFNLRGPDRSTKGKYGGTQMLDARTIVKLEETDRDPSKRFANEIDRNMRRADRS